MIVISVFNLNILNIFKKKHYSKQFFLPTKLNQLNFQILKSFFCFGSYINK